MVSLNLDDLDIRLLQLLQVNSRFSFAELSRELDVAEATVRFRVRRLVSEGVIAKFTIPLDPNKVGRRVSGAILLKLDPARLDEACKALIAFAETMYLFQSTGEYDVVSVVVARDLEHLNDLVKRAKAVVGVKDARVSIATQFLKFDPFVSLNL
ncbi:Lrp/AsnC family transcriptional regulator [Candidatus Bathycorpusculum sp.]|uniref:Lrp/AsnC family transcriptional regulator n=1 Tax=Candidatus Bathycorpusculum sp. TaxID=2994959 RepID=UPI002830F977|nr:Lrp/AsnC family transcriptional regulator [Candidatus Termitimicrobium sp.]